jgi:uncharacterized protein involved in type VI secretion and phage assembly
MTWDGGENRFGGLYAATVTSIDNNGRVQIRVPSVFDTTDSSGLTWARPCFPWAHFYLPDVNDQVWVAFENGDPGAPVWIGVWYPSTALPPTADVSKPQQRVIATPKKNLFVLDDTDGSESVTIKDKAGNSITMNNNGLVLTCQAGNTISLDSGGVTITSKGALTIDASGQTVEIKASTVNVVQS